MQIEDISKLVETNATSVAQLGDWPPYIQPSSLTDRIPRGEQPGPGFDAGIATALGIIPEDKATLSAVLHAAYTKDAVLQVRAEREEKDADSETTWWAAMSSLCREGEVSQSEFMEQVAQAERLAADPAARLAAAEDLWRQIDGTWKIEDYLGIPYGEVDGCMQAAYLSGYPVAVMWAEAYSLWFIGTYEPSLGLEEFPFSTKTDDQGRTLSGPVHGSKQFVKVSSSEELVSALKAVKLHLGL